MSRSSQSGSGTPRLLRWSVRLVVCLSLLSSVAAAKDPVRVWVDWSGNHAIEATLVDVKGDRVVLMTRQGKRIVIAIDKLSENDKQYIEDVGQPQTNRLRTNAPAPPKVEALRPLVLPQAKSIAPEGSTFDLSNAPPAVALTTLPGVITADRAPIVVPIAEQRFQIPKIESYDNVSNVISVGSADAPALGISISVGFSIPGERESINQLVRLDAETSKVNVVMKSSERVRLLDHHPHSGRSLLLMGHNPLGHGGRLAIASGWDRGSISVHHQRGFPNDEQLGQFPNIRWARLIDDEHFVAVVDRTFLAANLVSGKVLYKIEGVARKSVPAISGGRRYVAVPVEGAVGLYQSFSGKALGRIGTEPNVVPAVSFSNSGASLAIVTTRRMRIWSLPGAALRSDIATRRSLGSGSPTWVDSDLIMTSTGVLMSLFRGVPVWRYDIAGTVTDNVGNHIAILRKSPHTGVHVLKLPHQGAHKAMEWIDAVATTTDPEQWRVPGRSVWDEDGWEDRDVRVSAQPTAIR